MATMGRKPQPKKKQAVRNGRVVPAIPGSGFAATKDMSRHVQSSKSASGGHRKRAAQKRAK